MHHTARATALSDLASTCRACHSLQANFKEDYEEIAAVAPELKQFTLHQFTWGRMMAARL